MEVLEPALTGQFLGKPIWMWPAFISIVTLLVVDLGVRHNEQREIPVGESLVLSAVIVPLNRRCIALPEKASITIRNVTSLSSENISENRYACGVADDFSRMPPFASWES